MHFVTQVVDQPLKPQTQNVGILDVHHGIERSFEDINVLQWFQWRGGEGGGLRAKESVIKGGGGARRRKGEERLTKDLCPAYDRVADCGSMHVSCCTHSGDLYNRHFEVLRSISTEEK